MYNIGGGDEGAMVPHFYWTMLARKDRDTLIEQSATQSITLIEQSLYHVLFFKTASNYYSYILFDLLHRP